MSTGQPNRKKRSQPKPDPKQKKTVKPDPVASKPQPESKKSARRKAQPAPAPRKNTKVVGERSEANFLSKATDRDFGIAKPWGDSRRYDFILDNAGRLHRIQIKCTESLRARAYETRATYTTGKGRAVYTKKDIDFIAAHVVPLDIWYIIPVEICTPAPMLRFYPHRRAKKMRLEKYREAWHLIHAPDQPADDDPHQIPDLQASAEPFTHPAGLRGSFVVLDRDVILSEAKDLCTPPASPTRLTPRPRDAKN